MSKCVTSERCCEIWNLIHEEAAAAAGLPERREDYCKPCLKGTHGCLKCYCSPREGERRQIRATSGVGGADICDLQTKDKRSKCSEVDLVSSAEMNIWAAVTSSRQLTQKGNFDLGSVFDVSLKSV